MVRSKAKGIKYYYLARMSWELSGGSRLYYWCGMNPFKGDLARRITEAAKFTTRKELKEYLQDYDHIFRASKEFEGPEIIRMTKKEYFKVALQEKK